MILDIKDAQPFPWLVLHRPWLHLTTTQKLLRLLPKTAIKQRHRIVSYYFLLLHISLDSTPHKFILIGCRFNSFLSFISYMPEQIRSFMSVFRCNILLYSIVLCCIIRFLAVMHLFLKTSKQHKNLHFVEVAECTDLKKFNVRKQKTV